MEPAFYRGDILFLNNGPAPIAAGEVVVFNIDGRDIPIVHRVIKVHDRPAAGSAGGGGGDLEKGPAGSGTFQQDILTKGDNNWGDDRALYARGQQWLARRHIMGRVVGCVGGQKNGERESVRARARALGPLSSPLTLSPPSPSPHSPDSCPTSAG